jgi:uncharacterized alpha-E superfamily protein
MCWTDASADGRQGLEAVLEILDSSITYRSRYFAELRFAQAVDLILNDDGNPRSLLFQLQAISRHLDALPRLQDNPFPRREQALIHVRRSPSCACSISRDSPAIRKAPSAPG